MYADRSTKPHTTNVSSKFSGCSSCTFEYASRLHEVRVYGYSSYDSSKLIYNHTEFVSPFDYSTSSIVWYSALSVLSVSSKSLAGWWRGVVGNAFRLKRSYSTPGPVSTAMGDCLRAGKASRCEACQLGRLSLLSSVGR